MLSTSLYAFKFQSQAATCPSATMAVALPNPKMKERLEGKSARI